MGSFLRNPAMRRFAATQFLLEVQFWFPVWLIFLLERGFSLGEAVLADGVFRLVVVACEFPVGILADRIGRRPAYLWLAGGNAVTFAAITQVDSLTGLFGAWVLWGVVWALASGAANAYLYELCQLDHSGVPAIRAFGIVGAVRSLAVLLSLAAAGYLYAIDPRLPFALTSGLALLALVLTLGLPRVPKPASAGLAKLRVDLRAAARNPAVRAVVLLGSLLLLGGWSVRILFQPLALELELSPSTTGWMYTSFAAAGVAGSLLAARSGPLHRRSALAVAFLFVLVPVAGTAAFPAFGPFLLLPVLGLAYAFGVTVLDVMTSEVTAPAVRATTYGVISCLGGVGIAVARPGLGIIGEEWSVPIAFGVWAGVCLVLGAAMLPSMRRIGAVGLAGVASPPHDTSGSTLDGSGP